MNAQGPSVPRHPCRIAALSRNRRCARPIQPGILPSNRLGTRPSAWRMRPFPGAADAVIVSRVTDVVGFRRRSWTQNHFRRSHTHEVILQVGHTEPSPIPGGLVGEEMRRRRVLGLALPSVPSPTSLPRPSDPDLLPLIETGAAGFDLVACPQGGRSCRARVWSK
jgi:hypothetical protein